MDLIEKSINLIKGSQLKSGIIIGSHTHWAYKYCFLKDNSFSVYALDIMGDYNVGDKYYDWSSKKIIELEYKIANAIKRYKNNEKLLNSDYLYSIYNDNGIEDEQRSNFQLDGYGVWLWGICQHMKMTNQKKDVYIKSIELVAKYLECFWKSPCFGCWEEKDDRIHTSTLACICGGLQEAHDIIPKNEYNKIAMEIKTYILRNCVIEGRFSKYAFYDDIDSSLLFLALPFHVIELTDDRMIKTVSEIEKALLNDNGLHRYGSDSYFGGGRWINLTCWLAWYYKKVGNTSKLDILINWVENRSNGNGELPEQIIDKVLNYDYIERWKEIYGDIVCPSIWAHAMYIIAKKA
ncbi:hypothetical protein SH1V18_08860 [Vallitalea longa]|uniref:GH15-like domain-containing protein n=1 Tax=Vallitalea longa TaxID=2936439 RepID=A0A9W5Y9J3_9FIRM|nr:glycoside hydrolase family 15 protein [Vallitalea longa]GKX28406.1 hypothetical protein SH1V18_08860 [Vallitalea longa]